MRIPDCIWLGGIKITTKYKDDLCANEGLVGKANYRDQSIALDPSVCREQGLEQAYLHELVHWILFMMNNDALRKDEDFVDTFAHFLYQAHVMQDMNDIISDSENLKEQEIYKRKLYEGLNQPVTSDWKITRHTKIYNKYDIGPQDVFTVIPILIKKDMWWTWLVLAFLGYSKDELDAFIAKQVGERCG